MKTLTKEINIINEATIRFPIIANGSGWISTENDGLSVIESGGRQILFSIILKAIESAKHVVCLQSFLIQDTAIIDALIKASIERGVRVFVLSSAEARLKETIEEEEDFIKASYINLLDNKFKNHFVHRSAEQFHGKYILIDPTTNPNGFICTNNFTESGFINNPELAVELNKEQCEDLFKIFVYHFWEHSEDEQTATNEFAKVKALGKFNLPIIENILLTSPNTQSNSLNIVLLDAIKRAKRTITFSTFQLDRNTEIVKEIIEKAKQGKTITLFCRTVEKQFNEELKVLLEAGVQIYFHPKLHAKSLLVDDMEGFVFTANLTAKGLESGLEIGIRLNDQQTKYLTIIHQRWQVLFPFRAIKIAKVKELKEIHIFKDKKLIKKVLPVEEKSERGKIVKVSDLFSLFNRKFEIKDISTKSLKVKLTADIEDLPEKYKVIGKDKIEVLQIEESKGKNSQILIINDNFEVGDLPEIQELKELKIYYAKPA